MKSIIILSSVLLVGCVGIYNDPCVNIPVKEKVAHDPNERVYGWSKAELAAMPSWCGGSTKHTIYDRSGRIIGYVR